jgi:hypothetical protein
VQHRDVFSTGAVVTVLFLFSKSAFTDKKGNIPTYHGDFQMVYAYSVKQSVYSSQT